MASMWRQAMLYLGLGPDEEYDDLADQQHAAPYRSGTTEPEVEVEVEDSSVTLITEHDAGRRPDATEPPQAPAPEVAAPAAAEGAAVVVTSASANAALADAGIEPTGSVRTIPVSPAKPHVVAPRSFNDAQQVADRFKADQPIIVNLQGVDRDLSRRIIDFTSGLCYALNGNMEKVAESVYLLAPADVSLPEEERQRLQERGLHY